MPKKRGPAALLAVWLAVTPLTGHATPPHDEGSAEGTPAAVTLERGAAVELMVLTEVASGRAQAGDLVKLRVNAPVIIGGAVVVPVGTPAYGRVEKSEQTGGALQRGSLSVSLTHILIGDQRLSLLGAFDRRGQGGKNDDAVKLLLAPMYVLFSPGNLAKLKAGDLVVGHIGETYRVEQVGQKTTFQSTGEEMVR